MPIDLAVALAGSPRYRSVAAVSATRLAVARTWRTRRGSELAAQAGDWLVTDGTDEWTVAAAVFDQAYHRLPDGRFAKDAPVHAVRVEERVDVPTLEGASAAAPGDWVLQGVVGELWPVTDAYFRATYVRE